MTHRITLLLLLILLPYTVSMDTFNACKCLQRRLVNRTCHRYIHYIVPPCAPDLPLSLCAAVCCPVCTHQSWWQCHSILVRDVCAGLPAEPSPSTTPHLTPHPTPEIYPSLPPYNPNDEDDIDLTPVDGRPYSPAACECLRQGVGCTDELAAASGICKGGTSARKQSKPCVKTCCRMCYLAVGVVWCKVPAIKKMCHVRR